MTTLLPPGGSPERRSSYTTEASTEGTSTIKDKVLAIQREIGVKACDFVSRISYQDPFNLLSDGLYREITRKAVLKSAGSADLSDILPSRYQVRRAMEEDILVNRFVSSYTVVNQFATADAVFTMQKMPEIEQLLHAVRFLKGIDTLIEKIGFGPSPFS